LDGLRTPFGRFKGALSHLESRRLNATLIKALAQRIPQISHCDGVILGQVLQGGMGQNPARLAAAEAGLGLDVPALTLNNVCLAGMAAVADARRRILLGEGELYVVGGGDSMSRGRHAAVLREGFKAVQPFLLFAPPFTAGRGGAFRVAVWGPFSESVT